MLKESQSLELQIVRTYLEFLEADLTSDGKFNIYASYMENLKIQGFEQTSLQEGGGLEEWVPARYMHFSRLKMLSNSLQFSKRTLLLYM